MPKLTWNGVGNKIFHTGVDRGVLFSTNKLGVAWNGLTKVVASKEGGESNSYYIDGLKYTETITREDFKGQIEAYTYPDEFAIHDGTVDFNGMSVYHQPRVPFSMSYRTLVGNDTSGTAYGYKIHLIYNALAVPADLTYNTTNDNPEASMFSWDVSTTPIVYEASSRSVFASHISVDSTRVPAWKLEVLERRIYGAEGSVSILPPMGMLVDLFENNSTAPLVIQKSTWNGLNPVNLSYKEEADIVGNGEGLYSIPSDSRLQSAKSTGLFTLE